MKRDSLLSMFLSNRMESAKFPRLIARVKGQTHTTPPDYASFLLTLRIRTRNSEINVFVTCYLNIRPQIGYLSYANCTAHTIVPAWSTALERYNGTTETVLVNIVQFPAARQHWKLSVQEEILVYKQAISSSSINRLTRGQLRALQITPMTLISQLLPNLISF